MLAFTCACRCMVASLRCMSGMLTKGPFASSLPKPCSFHPGHPRWSTTFSAHQHARPTRSSTAHLPNFAHTPKRSFRPFTLHSNPPLCLPLQLRKSYCTPYRFALLDLRHLSPFLPTNSAQHVHDAKERNKTASCCEAGPRHEADGFLWASKTPARFVFVYKVASSRAAPART